MPKYRHGSVERNLVKRRLRELSRLQLLPALAASVAGDGLAGDLVVRATPAAYDATFDRLAADVARVVRELPRLLRQLRQLREQQPQQLELRPPDSQSASSPPTPAAPAQAAPTPVTPTAPSDAREEQSP